MRTIYGWMAKHRWLAIVLGSLLLCGVYTGLCLDTDTPIWLVILLNLVLIFCTYATVDNAPLYLLKNSIAELDHNCNPVPLGLELEKLLTYKNSEVTQQSLLMNYTLALDCIGNYEKSYEILSSINIDKSAKTLPGNKIVYYNNRMEQCMHLEKYEEACVWYLKASQMYADMKKSKHKEILKNTVQEAEAVYYFCKKEYEKAAHILDASVPRCLRAKVEDAYLYAKICLALGDEDKAREKLTFVIQNGNKLHYVEEAKKILERL